MKKLISLALCALLLSSAFVSCAPSADRLDSAVALASSDAAEQAQWLDYRLETFPTDVVIGIGSNNSHGVDMSDFESDGYVLRTVGNETLIFGKTTDGLDRAVRAYAKAAEAGTASELDTVYHEGLRIKRFTVAGRDISEYTIYYPADANENMLFAVSELKRLVKKACGADLAAVEGAPSGYAIEFRHSTDAELKNDGYRYSVGESGILFEGAVKRGCMYAVWRFLENECGWTSLTYGDSYLTPADHLDVPAGTEAGEVPAFEYLNSYRMFYDDYVTERATPTNAQNSYGTLTQAHHGMQTYNFDDQGGGLSQICYTSESIFYVVFDNVTEFIEARLSSGSVIGQDFLEIDLSQRDSRDYCQCKDCLKIFKAEGNTNAGPLVYFINKFSEEMNEYYPGLYYKVFAYDETNKPPKTAPNEMVYITFCYDITCVNHKADGTECTTFAKNQFTPSGRNNVIFSEWFKGWCELTDNMYVWFYGLELHLQSLTYVDNLYDDFRFFAENGVKGIFWEAEFMGFNLGRVEKQLGTKLLWDMDMTREKFDALYMRLLEQNFGDGWYYIYEYVKLWNAAQDRGGCYHCWLFDQHVVYTYDTDYQAELFDQMYDLLEKAIPLAGSATQERRCEVFSCHMLYKGCYSSYFKVYDAQDTERLAVLEDRYELMISRLLENGFNPHALPNIAGNLNFEEDITTEAWKYWQPYRYRLAPDEESWLPMPEGLKVEVHMPFIGGYMPE